MTDGGQTSERVQHPGEGVAPPPPTADRSARFTAANMLRSLLPLVVLCLLIVAWTTWRQSGDERVQTVDPSSTIQLAAARASYPVVAPTGLPEEYLVTSARTDAGQAEEEGDTVTLEIGFLTPSEEFAGFVVSDDPGAGPVVDVVADGEEQGEVEIGGQTWRQLTTGRGETAFVREDGRVIVAVTGSATDDELRAVAAAVEPYSN